MSSSLEQLVDELDLAFHAWLFVMDVATFDGSDGFNPAQGGLGCSQ